MSDIGRYDDMTEDEIQEWVATLEFSSLCRQLNERVSAGEPMTMEYMAHFLRVPWMFFAGALAGQVHKMSPETAIYIDDTKGALQ